MSYVSNILIKSNMKIKKKIRPKLYAFKIAADKSNNHLKIFDKLVLIKEMDVEIYCTFISIENMLKLVINYGS